MDDRAAQMEQIEKEVTQLKASPLYAFRVEHHYKPVIGEGSLTAKVMFIGEAPGSNEARSGRPFVGAAGKILNELLASAGLDRGDVYITNIVKDRPPENRDPSPEEISLYAPFLKRQIEIIQPAFIATLGRFSMDFILGLYHLPEQGQKISALHGKVLKIKLPDREMAFVPLFHPAVAIYNRDQKETLQADFMTLKKL